MRLVEGAEQKLRVFLCPFAKIPPGEKPATCTFFILYGDFFVCYNENVTK